MESNLVKTRFTHLKRQFIRAIEKATMTHKRLALSTNQSKI